MAGTTRWHLLQDYEFQSPIPAAAYWLARSANAGSSEGCAWITLKEHQERAAASRVG